MVDFVQKQVLDPASFSNANTNAIDAVKVRVDSGSVVGDAIAAAIASGTVPAATDTVQGKVALNLGTAAGDATNATDALTATGLAAILNGTAPNSSPNALQAAVANNPSIGAGQIIYHAASTAPVGFLKANGALVSRTLYQALFSVIGTTFGVGDGSTTFGLPDLRGEFLRVWDDGRGVDSARAFGTLQLATATLQKMTDWTGTDSVLSSGSGIGQAYSAPDSAVNSSNPPNPIFSGNGSPPSTGNFNDNLSLSEHQTNGDSSQVGKWITYRPRNVALLACIKF